MDGERTQSKPEWRSQANRLLIIANAFGYAGWLSVCFQTALGVALVVALVFAASSSHILGEEPTPGISIGIFWAVCGVVVLLVAIATAYRYVRIARRLRLPTTDINPKGSEVVRLLRLSIVLGAVGMLLTLVGAGASVAVLLAKAAAQPDSVVLYNDPQRIIRALDLYVVAANLNGIAAHFVGATTALSLLDWLRRQ